MKAKAVAPNVRELSRLQEATSSNPEFVRRLFFAVRVAAMQVDPRATSNNRPGNIYRAELEHRFENYAVILPNNRRSASRPQSNPDVHAIIPSLVASPMFAATSITDWS
jgi:hypothetical protein